MLVQVEQQNVPLAYNWTDSSLTSCLQHIDYMVDKPDLVAVSKRDYKLFFITILHMSPTFSS